jgi:peptidyl-prolyl cis-trans isomerase B (cyclophilin B)
MTRITTILCSLAVVTAVVGQEKRAEVQRLVEIRTDLGTMVVALYNETPQHRDNFLKLVTDGAYDSLLIHRIVPTLMVQGGDPDSRLAGPDTPLGNGGPGYTLPAEIVPGLIHKKGALAAVRLGEDVDPEKRSNGSQFYIVHGKPFQPNELSLLAQRSARMGTPVTYTEEQQRIYATEGGAPHLDGAYTIFGEVVEGLEVLDALAKLSCDGNDRPMQDVRMFIRLHP